MTQRQKLEDYMKTIYRLSRKGSVRGVDISRSLNVSRPTVSVSLRQLEQEGYVELRDNRVTLTEKGLAIAEEISDRNTEICRMLKELGVDEATAEKDACNMEHAISRESFSALLALADSRQEA